MAHPEALRTWKSCEDGLYGASILACFPSLRDGLTSLLMQLAPTLPLSRMYIPLLAVYMERPVSVVSGLSFDHKDDQFDPILCGYASAFYVAEPLPNIRYQRPDHGAAFPCVLCSLSESNLMVHFLKFFHVRPMLKETENFRLNRPFCLKIVLPLKKNTLPLVEKESREKKLLENFPIRFTTSLLFSDSSPQKNVFQPQFRA
ncbi:hypothetical protein VNO77_08700 [Canavalia gladiata]|uniref:Uncharacterized protein n=1 Tax=Canavalia gladiata TaxID=3824 RepID=A0AAN9QW99_CANGL